MRGERGFGIVTVMAGAVVLGIFAMVYVQSAQNRANISLIGDLMSFREQVMTYYSSVVANRGTWECTVKATSGTNSLKAYLRLGGVNKSGALNIYDYSGDCQEGFASSDGELLIASGGLGLKLQDYNDVPLVPALPCDDDAGGTHFCLKATWKGLDTAVGQKRAVELKLALTANRKAIKQQLDVNFDLKDREHTIFMNRAVATDCSDGRVTGLFPGSGAPHPTGTGVVAYAGDTAIVSLDAVTGLVQCSGRGPLVIPPCYDVTSTTNNPFRSNTGMTGRHSFTSTKGFGDLTSDFGLRCDGGPGGRTTAVATKGSCPRTGSGGTTAIAYFDPQTGIAQCSHPNILVEKVDISDTAKHCDGDNRFGIVRISETGTFTCSTHYGSPRWGTRRGGVEPGRGRCSTGQALAGFGSDGSIDSCIDSDGRGTTNAMPGLSGPQGEHGDSGAWLHSQCRGDSGCTHEREYPIGYGNSEIHPAGPGVRWWRGPTGAHRDNCPSGCDPTYYQYARCTAPSCS